MIITIKKRIRVKNLCKLNAKKYDFSPEHSSLSKGEDIYDTINNLSAIGLNTVVLRHSDDNLIKELVSKQYFQEISFINAGSGKSSHPTQALLDFYTMKKHFLDLNEKIITIVGDIAHSRVAKSNIALLKKYGMKIRCLTDDFFKGEEIEGVQYFSNLPEAFEDADVIMALRIQKERIEQHYSLDEYISKFQITKENLPYAALLMHPGPVNRDIEIKSDVLETRNARTVLNQAKNGVWVRMAVMDMIFASWGI